MKQRPLWVDVIIAILAVASWILTPIIASALGLFDRIPF